MGKRKGKQRTPEACPTTERGAEPNQDPASDRRWIDELDDGIRLTERTGGGTVRTSLSAHTDHECTTLFVPPEMPSLQPRSLHYLQALAASNDIGLVEDRRQNHVSPLIEQRDGKPPAIALGLALLMKQTGLPGPTAQLSAPHRLSADSPLIDLPELIAVTAYAVPLAKRVVLLPNQPLVEVLDNDTLPITGYAARVDSASAHTVLSHFDGPALRGIGYSTGRQYVMHLLLAGGSTQAPALWTHPHTLTRTDLRFRLFRGRSPRHDVGLLYSTFYFDLEKQEPQPWWLSGHDDESRQPSLDAVG